MGARAARALFGHAHTIALAAALPPLSLVLTGECEGGGCALFRFLSISCVPEGALLACAVCRCALFLYCPVSLSGVSLCRGEWKETKAFRKKNTIVPRTHGPKPRRVTVNMHTGDDV